MIDISSLAQQAERLLNQASGIVTFATGLCGLALTYAGLKVYWIGVFLAGMPLGAIGGGAIGLAMKWPQESVIAAAVVGAFIGGSIAVASLRFAVAILGALGGAALALVAGAQEPVVCFIAAVVCGILAVLLHDVAVVISTAAAGAWLMLFTVVNIFVMMKGGQALLTPWQSGTYAARLGASAWQAGSLDGAIRALGSDIVIFLFFFVTGMLVQFNLHRFIAVPEFGRKKPSVKQNPSSRAKPDEGEQRPAKAIPAAKSAQSWQVSFFQNGQHLQTRPLAPGAYLVGRDAGIDFHLDDPAVSRRHLEIAVFPDGALMLQDIGSANGTWKFGKEKIDDDAPGDGTWYQMGAVQMMFKAKKGH